MSTANRVLILNHEASLLSLEQEQLDMLMKQALHFQFHSLNGLILHLSTKHNYVYAQWGVRMLMAVQHVLVYNSHFNFHFPVSVKCTSFHFLFLSSEFEWGRVTM